MTFINLNQVKQPSNYTLDKGSQSTEIAIIGEPR